MAVEETWQCLPEKRKRNCPLNPVNFKDFLRLEFQTLFSQVYKILTSYEFTFIFVPNFFRCFFFTFLQKTRELFKMNYGKFPLNGRIVKIAAYA